MLVFECKIIDSGSISCMCRAPLSSFHWNFQYNLFEKNYFNILTLSVAMLNLFFFFFFKVLRVSPSGLSGKESVY